MAALTEDRNTGQQEGHEISMGVATAITIYGGSMVAKNAGGYATPAADAANLVVMGMALEKVVNAGANGAETVRIMRGRSFWFANSAANAVTIAHVGGNVYVEDDQTVASAGGVNSIVAGKCLAVDATKGVLVWIA